MNTESMQIIIGIGQILAVAIIPIIVWWLGIKYQDRYLQTVVTQCFVNNKSEIWS